MTTFAGWLAEQRKREDAVGWFARYWHDLPETPRLSSPSSICAHLEDRTAKPGQDKAGNYLPFGFKDPDGGGHVRDAYDQTLHEYRAVRTQIVSSAVPEAGVPGPQDDAGVTPGAIAGAGMPGAGESLSAPPDGMTAQPQSPAGVAVQRATAAAQAAVAARPPQLDRIERMLAGLMRKFEGIERTLGLWTDDDGYPLDAELPWADWYARADLAAVPE